MVHVMRWCAKRGRIPATPEQPRLQFQSACRLVLVVVLSVFAAGGACCGQLSGKISLDLVARRIPTTVTDEIKLNTPSEFAMLEFGIASNLDVRVGLGFLDLAVDTATNMAGPEHLVLSATAKSKNLNVYGLRLDELELSPEVWVAVPFEAVVDVNNLPNAVVIPPADPLFVALRFTTSFSRGEWSLKQLVMFQDTNFPSPGSSFTPLHYPVQSQSFAWGSLTYVSWRAPVATSLSGVIGLSASNGPTSVKGYSAVGRVDPGNVFVTLSASSVLLGDLRYGALALSNFQMSASTTLTPTQTPSVMIGFSASLSKDATISTSLTLYDLQPLLGGITVSFGYGPYRAAFAIDHLALTSLSVNCSTPLNLGALTGAFSISGTGLERGLTGLALQLTVAQGVLSAGTNVAFAQRGEEFGFASLGTQLAFRFSPGVISVQATFGRYGLTRGAFSMGVNF